jgi:IS1 family transposase
VKVKQGHIASGNDRTKIGDQWTFVAIDAETKLVPSYRVGKRTRENAIAFMTDLSERLRNRVQISLASLRSYVDAVEQVFGANVDYGQIVKFYDVEPIGPGRHGPPRVTGAERTVISGSPDKRLISNSMIERQNLTMRMLMRRFTRLTNAFSKKLENLQAAGGSSMPHGDVATPLFPDRTRRRGRGAITQRAGYQWPELAYCQPRSSRSRRQRRSPHCFTGWRPCSARPPPW